MQIQAYLAAAAVNLKRLAAAIAAAVILLLMNRSSRGESSIAFFRGRAPYPA